jgi:hypothetical protein
MDSNATMRLRLQAQVTGLHGNGVASLLMDPKEEGYAALKLIATGCPAGLAVGQSAVFAGTAQMRAEQDDSGRLVIILQLAVAEVTPSTHPRAWAYLEGEVTLMAGAKTMIAPTMGPDGAIVISSVTGAPASLPATNGKKAALQVLRRVNDPVDGPRGERDAMADALALAQAGDHLRVAGDICLVERAPDDEPGHDLQLQVTDLAQIA